MQTALTRPAGMDPDAARLKKAGIVLLTKSLGPQELARHKAEVAFELEVVSRKIDRFGWESMPEGLRKRLLVDWITALADYTVAEVRAAIAAILADKPDHATNEQKVRAVILTHRKERLAAVPAPAPRQEHRPTPDPEMKARVDAIVKSFTTGTRTTT